MTSARRVAAWDQPPEETLGTAETVLLWRTQETEQLGPGRWWDALHTWESVLIKHLVSWAPGPGKGSKRRPNQSAPLWSTREPEPEQLRPGKCMQPRARFGRFPCRATWSLSSVDQESTHCELGQTQSGLYTTRTPHTCQWYLLAVFLPHCSTTEQMSLNKWPPSPPCVRAEIRRWRDLQTEEAKRNRGNHFGSDSCNRLKPCISHQLHWKGQTLRSISWNKKPSKTELTPHCPQQLQRNS